MSHYKKSIERLLEIAECLLFCCREFWKVCLLFHTFDFYTFKNYTFESVRVERLCHIGHLKVNTQTKTGLDAFFEHAWNIEGTKKVEKITI